MFGSAEYTLASAASKVPSSMNVQSDKTGFSEIEAWKDVKALSDDVASHSVDSQADPILALQYVIKESQNIKETIDREVDVEVDLIPLKSGDSDLKNAVLRILPKSASEAKEQAILVFAHVDVDAATSTKVAGDDHSNVAVMLELARGISQSSQELKNGVIFLFNNGKEDGLEGAQSFITKHPWSDAIRVAIDLDSVFAEGKKRSVFQEVLPPGAIKSALDFPRLPTGDIHSATDFQVYEDVSRTSDEGRVYHTKNDKLELLKPGSIKHLGDNMLAFLLQGASTSDPQ